jgi:hypothetical protein
VEDAQRNMNTGGMASLEAEEIIQEHGMWVHRGGLR